MYSVMIKTKKHRIRKLEVSIMELQNHKNKKFKVTRRIPSLFVAETKIFRNKKKALKQFNDWLK